MRKMGEGGIILLFKGRLNNTKEIDLKGLEKQGASSPSKKKHEQEPNQWLFKKGCC